MNQNHAIIDKIKWFVWSDTNGYPNIQPLCPRHNLRMYPKLKPYEKYASYATLLRCEECDESYSLPRGFEREKQYVLDKIFSRSFKGVKFINLDDEALPIAETKISQQESDFFVTGSLTKSKVGLRLVVYAGQKGKKEKTQIFVEPEIKRLAFDQTNLHPTDVFTMVEATFEDGTRAKMEKRSKK